MSEKEPLPSELSVKDELDLRLKITQIEHQLTDNLMKATREDVRAIIDSYRKLMQGPLILNAAALLVFLNQWTGLTNALGRGPFALIVSLFALGVLTGMMAIYVAILQTTVPMKAPEEIMKKRWWDFYISAGCFNAAIGVGISRLWAV